MLFGIAKIKYLFFFIRATGETNYLKKYTFFASINITKKNIL